VEQFKVGAVQASPVFMDREATVEKAAGLVRDAAAAGARLIVFPEAFVPTYPMWLWALKPSAFDQIPALHAELMSQAVDLTKDHLGPLQAAAKEAGVVVTIGVNELFSEGGSGTMFNSYVCIGPDGSIIGRRRKLMPTAPERMIWGMGDGSTLGVFDAGFAKLGALICWENYMPLARYAMYAEGAEVILAPTWDEGETWEASMKHIAKEGRAYVVCSSIAMKLDEIPERYAFREAMRDPDDPWLKQGGTMIVEPTGKVIAGPLNGAEGILYADLDPSVVLAQKWNLDVCGHYSRPDVFRFSVDRRAKLPMDREPV
jgi:nitrilase